MSHPSDTLARLSGELTIAHAAAQHQALLEQLSQAEGSLRLDLAGIDGFDSAGLQLLLATQKQLAARGAELQLEGLPAALTDALAVYGLDAQLQPLHGAAA